MEGQLAPPPRSHHSPSSSSSSPQPVAPRLAPIHAATAATANATANAQRLRSFTAAASGSHVTPGLSHGNIFPSTPPASSPMQAATSSRFYPHYSSPSSQQPRSADASSSTSPMMQQRRQMSVTTQGRTASLVPTLAPTAANPLHFTRTHSRATSMMQLIHTGTGAAASAQMDPILASLLSTSPSSSMSLPNRGSVLQFGSTSVLHASGNGSSSHLVSPGGGSAGNLMRRVQFLEERNAQLEERNVQIEERYVIQQNIIMEAEANRQRIEEHNLELKELLRKLGVETDKLSVHHPHSIVTKEMSEIPQPDSPIFVNSNINTPSPFSRQSTLIASTSFVSSSSASFHPSTVYNE